MRNAVLEERTRIAGEIHDSVGHSLTSLIVQMQALRYRVKQDPEGSVQALDEMLTVARQGLQDIRNSVHAMAGDPSLPGIAALRALLARADASASIECSFETDLTDEDLDTAAFETLYRVLQEAVTNVIRHSRATRVEVRLSEKRGGLRLSIRDNGIAEPGQPFEEGFGLRMMRRRLEETGGSLHVTAQSPHGLMIVAELPEPEAREEE
nr:sensor histidine kinase [Cohnella zeiphila]